MNDADVYASCDSYGRLIEALAHRAAELGMTHAAVDQLAGLQEGYTSKCFGPSMTKHLGALTLFLVLPALGLRLTLIRDDAAAEQSARRVIRRNHRQARPANLAQKKCSERVRERALRELATLSWSEAKGAIAAAKAKLKVEKVAAAARKANSNGHTKIAAVAR